MIATGRKHICVACCSAVLLLLAAACASESPRAWRLPQGQGNVRYSPERGIYREGASVNGDEGALYLEAVGLFNAGEYLAAARVFHRLRTDEAFVDGARALDAIMLEAVAELEAGRLSHRGWRLHDLANARFDGNNEAASRLPAGLSQLLGENGLRDIAREVVQSGALEKSWEVVKVMLTYYTLALGVAPERMNEATLQARNLAWLAYTAEEYSLAETIAKDLIDRHPRAEIKAMTELVLARTSTATGAHERAQELFARVYAGSRNPDLREEALLGEVEAILRRSKGAEYNRGLYEIALEKLNDYRYDFLAVHPDARLKAKFDEAAREVERTLVAMELAAADAYSRLGEEEATKFYRARAAQLERQFGAARRTEQ